MKLVFDRAVAMMLGLFACVAQAAMEDGGAAPGARAHVSVVWVVVFLAIFVGICAWIGIAIWRNERKNAAKGQRNAQATPRRNVLSRAARPGHSIAHYPERSAARCSARRLARPHLLCAQPALRPRERAAHLLGRGAADMVAGIDRAFQRQHGEHVLRRSGRGTCAALPGSFPPDPCRCRRRSCTAWPTTSCASRNGRPCAPGSRPGRWRWRSRAAAASRIARALGA